MAELGPVGQRDQKQRGNDLQNAPEEVSAHSGPDYSATGDVTGACGASPHGDLHNEQKGRKCPGRGGRGAEVLRSARTASEAAALVANAAEVYWPAAGWPSPRRPSAMISPTPHRTAVSLPSASAEIPSTRRRSSASAATTPNDALGSSAPGTGAIVMPSRAGSIALSASSRRGVP